MINYSNRYAMYLRKSRKDIELEQQGEGETLSRHLKILEELCKKFKIVVEDEDIYKEVVSGESIEARPEMQRLLNKVEQGYYRSVLVVEIERLARGDSIDQGIILRAFKLSDTKIITPSKTYDFKEEIDEEYMEFGLFMSRREYKIITKRLQRGRLLSAQEGKFVGSRAPFGYVKIKLKGQKGYSLKIDTEKADTVKTIFNLFVTHKYKPTEICNYLNNLSIPSPKNELWSVSGIREILKNPVYKGYILFNERVVLKDVKDSKIYKSRHTNKGDLKDLIYVKGLHEAIISEEIFEKASEIRKQRDVSPVNKNYDLQNPLSGLLKCKLCGKSLVRYTMRGTKRVYCRTHNCKNISNSIDDIEKEVLAFLENWIKDKELCYNLNQQDNDIELNLKTLEIKEKELINARRKKEKIYDLFEEQVYDKNTFFERNEKIQNTIDNLEKEIKQLRQEINTKENIARQKNTFIPRVKFVLDNYNEINNPKEKNQMLKSIISKIEYLKTKPGNKWHSTQFELWVYPKLPKSQ